ASRTEESCASLSHCASGENLYFCCTFFEGKLSYVHIPSSARAASAQASRAGSRANRFIFSSPRKGAALSASAARRSRESGLRHPGEQGSQAEDLELDLGVVQPLGREMALRPEVRVEVHVAAVEGGGRLQRRFQLAPRHLGGAEVELGGLGVPIRPGQVGAIVQPQVLP